MESDLYTPPPPSQHSDPHGGSGITDDHANLVLLQKMEQLIYKFDHMSRKVDIMNTDLAAIKRALSEQFNKNI